MSYWQIALLAVIQGAAELLPVSSSAHVILAAKLMGQNPSSSEFTFLLVMLHTGTMFAVLFYFWPRWKALWTGRSNESNESPARSGPVVARSPDRATSSTVGLQSAGAAGETFGQAQWPGQETQPQRSPARAGWHFLLMVVLATAVTGVVGQGLIILIEDIVLVRMLGHEKGEVEVLFKELPLVGTALAAAGLLIIAAGFRDGKEQAALVNSRFAIIIGLVQSLCVPFRGFSRSGATISTALFCGISRPLAEDFSFALAVALTPPAIARLLLRLLRDKEWVGVAGLFDLLLPGLVGMAFSFLAGLLALKLLSAALEKGHWKYFGYYCLVAAGAVFLAAYRGY
jgi:undecaprenyl-diphosphatase